MASSCVRGCISLKSLNMYPLSVRSGNSSLISLRWRKPRWVPKTQSKLFYVRKPTVRDEEEDKALLKNFAIYRTQMKAIRSYFTKFVAEEKAERMEYKFSVEVEEELARFKLAVEVNKLWNEESAKLREARILAEGKENAELKAIEDEKQKKRDEKQLAELQSRIDENIKSAEKFITLENMDVEIEKVLNSRVNYNFPINKSKQIDKRDPTINTMDT